MSFAGEVKKEILRTAPTGLSRIQAQAYGMLLFGRSFSRSCIALQTENKEVADLYVHNLLDLVPLSGGITTIHHPKKQGGIFVVSVDDEEDRISILKAFGHSPDELNLRIHRALLREDDIPFFLRGAYLVCGNITDPAKGYHAELVVSYRRLCEDLQQLLMENGSHPKYAQRRGVHLLYYKESEEIEDLLTGMGATQCSLELMNVKIYKDVRNKVNRVTNCETANIEKTVAASAAQVEDIPYLWEKKGKNSLPEELQELAQLRVDNPEMSLRELGEALGEPITRSGVNHRLKRLSRMAQQLRGED